MYKQIYHNLIIVAPTIIVKLFLGMFKYESAILATYCLMFNAVNL